MVKLKEIPPCPGKVWYPNKKDAKIAAKKYKKIYKKEYYWYFCAEHQGWHLTTHSKQWVREFNQKIHKIIKQRDKK